MAAPRAKLFIPGVVSVATSAQREEHPENSQEGDLTAFTRAPAAAAVAAASAAPKPKAAAAPKLKTAAPKSKAAAKAPDSYGEASKYAIEIVGQESKNPYMIKDSISVYPLQTRLGFQDQILKVFSSFIKIPEFGVEPDFDACKKLGAGAGAQVEMYEYQKFVREYVRQAAPYRGLLVYHGLGSGKTCSAIAAAEALFSVSRKRIIVMTPSSLRYNFVREITFCGFRHFRLQNHWSPLSLQDAPIVRLFASQVLHLKDTFIKKVGQIWVPDFTQPPNFNSLSDEERRQITQQIEAQITSSITFINYNGIKATTLKEIACAAPDANGYRFFDNSVIVVDEIHNLTRLMQGTIEPYLTSLAGMKGRKVPMEPVAPGPWNPELCKKPTDPRRPYTTNYKRGYLFYRLLSGARNSKIIGLSGTPLINFPEEIAILANLIGGYINICKFVVSPATEENRTKIRQVLIENPYVDFEEVDLLGVNMNVTFSVLAEGLKKAIAQDGTTGVERINTVTPTIQETAQTVIAKLMSSGMRIVGTPEFKSEPLLPPIGEEFRNNFINGSNLKNTVVLRKRLQGLISYYRGSKKELMPTVTIDTVVNVPLSPYAQADYQRIRGEEINMQQEQKKKKGTDEGAIALGAAGRMANLWADIYEISKLKQSNSYRMASRQACNFSFPEGITRPRPRDMKDASAEIGDETDDIIADVPAKEGGEVELEEAAADADAEAEAIEEAAKEDELIDDAEKEAAKEAAGDSADAAAAAAAEVDQAISEEQTLLIPESGAVAPTGTLIPAAAPVAAEPQEGKKTLTSLQTMKIAQEKKKEDCKRGVLPGENYNLATKRSKDCLRIFASQKLRLFPPGEKTQQKINDGAPSDPERLMKYSPKFAAILRKILEAPGSSLVYSQFLDLAGIGIFSVVLDINDFHRIDIEVDDEGKMRFGPTTIANLKKGPGANRYLTFTGIQSSSGFAGISGRRRYGSSINLRNMALKLFNARYSDGKFIDLPPEMSEALVAAGFTGNLKGELCRVFCITSAGAEGLSLRNVRRVHIMEPFWNHVRTDQVKGRAVRICSHIDLDYSPDETINQRTVEVYTYCSVYSTEALLKPDGSTGFPRIDQTILNTDGMKAEEAKALGFDVPEGASEYIVTSDQYLNQLSERKKKVLQNIQNLMKTNAVDCKINMYENGDDGLGCIKLPGTPQQYAIHPDLKKDIAETSTKYPDESLVSDSAPAPAPSAADAFSGDAAAAAAASEGELAPAPAPAPVLAAAAPAPAPKPKRTIKAREIIINKVPYLAVPVLQKGQIVPLTYNLYGRADLKMVKKVGTADADSDGKPISPELF